MLTAEHPRQAIPAVNAEFATHFAAGDSAGVAALYTAEGRLLPPGAPVVEGHEGIAAFWGAVMEMGVAHVDLRTAAIDVANLDRPEAIAVETGTFTLGTADGGVVGTGKYLVTWKNEGGRWRLDQDIWNMDTDT